MFNMITMVSDHKKCIMGEIMTEMSLDDTTSYVLTEDMIDAAMNEQFSYQVICF